MSFCLLLWAGPALAQGALAALAPPELAAGIADLGKALDKVGVKFDAQEQGELWAGLVGGGKRGTSADGLLTASLSVDLDKAVGWHGANFFANGFYIQGHGPTRSLVGNLQNVSNIEAAPSLKLYDLWLEQQLVGDRLTFRFGQEAVGDEMMITAYGALLLNSSFGFPGLAAADLPSGGPSYPLATPFARLQLKPDEHVTAYAALFSGDPAPPGPGDPQIRDRNGTAFRLDDHALLVGEVWYDDTGKQGALPTTYKLGAWFHTGRFADQRFDSAGGLLAANSGLPAREHAYDWAVYASIDRMLWQRPGKDGQGIGVFLRFMAAPSDRNLSSLGIEGGVNWWAPFRQRPDDKAGLGFARLGIGSAARDFSRDLVFLGRAAFPYAAAETVIEATYLAQLTAWLSLQPDLQLVLDPGAGIPGRFGPNPLKDALIVGTRATVKF